MGRGARCGGSRTRSQIRTILLTLQKLWRHAKTANEVMVVKERFWRWLEYQGLRMAVFGRKLADYADRRALAESEETNENH